MDDTNKTQEAQTTGTPPPVVASTTAAPGPTPVPAVCMAAPAAPAPAAKELKPEKETKIALTLRENSALIGIQRTGCDPVFFTMTANLTPLLTGLHGFIAEAERRWQINPRYPKTTVVTEPPAPPRPATGAKTAAASPGKPAAPKTTKML